MKKINSIWYGGTILGIGLIFTFRTKESIHSTKKASTEK
jgi:hypothetical protein